MKKTRGYSNPLVSFPSAAAALAEGRAVGLALGGGVLVFHLDVAGRAFAVDGVVFAVGHVAVDAGDITAATVFRVCHIITPQFFCRRFSGLNSI